MANPITAESEVAKITNQKRKHDGAGEQNSRPAWRTANDQSMYSSMLVTALRRVRPTMPLQRKSRLVREAADRALAAAARGRTRWSRSILSNKLSSSSSLLVKVKKPKITSPPARRHRQTAEEMESSPAIERKAKVLGRIVPGCRKVALPALLEETSDYIGALQMQIRVMSVLAELLSTAGTSTPPPRLPPPPTNSSQTS